MKGDIGWNLRTSGVDRDLEELSRDTDGDSDTALPLLK